MASARPVPGAGRGSANPRVSPHGWRYLVPLAVAAIIGAPIAALAYGFLALVSWLQRAVFRDLPTALHVGSAVWWPLVPLSIAGALVALIIRYLPGHGGHSPADGFQVRGAPTPRELPGIILAALATLGSGAVLGPEAPLIAIGSGLAAAVPRLFRRDPPEQATSVVGAAGGFAAISTLLGSPLTGAFLLMEASGLGGSMLDLVLVPGLLAAGLGALIFVGLDAWTGLGTYSLALADIPRFTRPTATEFGWAIVIGALAAGVGAVIRRLAWLARAFVRRWSSLMTTAMGLAIGGLAIGYATLTHHPASDVLFSGQSQLGGLIAAGSGYSVAALATLVASKGLAYGLSMSCFRGGPVFPAMFIGAAGGIALSHLPGLPLIAGAAMGIGAMCVVMLALPLTSVLLATLLLYSAGLALTPLVIVSVVVAYVIAAKLLPAPNRGTEVNRYRAAADTSS